ncbi:MAG: efflux RND transporter periplasmic adaptor subunit [Halioglobus sp.]
MAVSTMRNGLAAAVVMLVGGALAYALLTGKPQPAPEDAPAYVPPSVDVVLASPGSVALDVQAQGTVHPHREIQLVSQVSGKVEEVADQFAQGGFFAAGESLVKVEDMDYQFAIARAQSQVAAAKQVVAEEEGRALQARREWRDLGNLQANDLFLRKPQIASAKASLKAAEADLAAAKLDLERTQITAPFNGRIKEKLVDVGQYIAPGAPVATIYDTDVVEVRIPLTDRQVALLDLPLNATYGGAESIVQPPITLRARFGNREWEWAGAIVRTDALIDVSSRLVYAVAEVQKPFAPSADGQRPPLSPGLFVKVSVAGRALDGVTEIARSAVSTDGTVMVVDDEGLARARVVQVLESDAQRVWLQGLAEGERVIVRHSAPVITGMIVEVNEPVSDKDQQAAENRQTAAQGGA